jgi:peptide/nickel transport system substrate-binding protein
MDDNRSDSAVRISDGSLVKRRDVLRGGGVLAAGMVGSAILSACSGGGKVVGGSSTGSKSTKTFQNLVVSEPSPPTSFDPAVSTANVGVFQEMYEGLLGLTPDESKVFPALATEMLRRIDDVTWQATLRDDRTFTNGKPIKPSDVKYSWDRIKSASLGSAYTEYLQFVQSVTVTGKNTVEFKTVAPVEIFPYRVPMVRTVSEAAVEQMGNANFSKHGGVGSGSMYNTQPLGPAGISLVRYKKYNGVLPVYTDKVDYEYYPNQSTAFAGLEGGQVNVVPFLDPQYIKTAKSNSSLQVGLVPVKQSTLVCLILFNCAAKPFNDQRVRQAVMYAMDREQLVSVGTLGYAVVADSPLPATNPYHVTPPTTYPHDPDKAKFLLKQAGYPDGLTFSLYVSNLGATANYAPLLQQQLSQAGITAKVRVLSVDAYFSEIFAGKYQSFVFPTQFGALSPDVDMLIRGWWGGYYNSKAAFWNTPAANSIPGLLNKALYSSSEEVKRTTYADIQEIIMSAAANCPIIYQGGVCAWTSNMGGFQPPAAGSETAVYKVRPA